jgi:hypothetical protein
MPGQDADLQNATNKNVNLPKIFLFSNLSPVNGSFDKNSI